MRSVGREDLFWRDLGSRPRLGTTGFCLALCGVEGGIHQCPVPSPTEAMSEQENILQPTQGVGGGKTSPKLLKSISGTLSSGLH